LANAIKEILMAIKNPGKGIATPVAQVIETDQRSIDQKAVAVLPFASLARDAAQDYFAEGITENVLNQLASGSSLRVISRTSAMRYKNSEMTVPEIARELGVKFIVEGSAQVHREKVRIGVKLIDATTDAPLWSKVFTESVDDLFDVQDRVADAVCTELNSSIGNSKKSEGAPTRNREAYDFFLKGRHAFNQWSVNGYRSATGFFKQAIALDPQFQQAYSYLASSYSARMSWNGDLSPVEAEQNISLYLNEAWRLGATDNDYLTRAFVEFFIRKNFAEAEKLLAHALELNSNNTGVLYAQCYLYCVMGNVDAAQRVLDTARQLDPLTVGYFNYQVLCDYLKGDYQKALSTLHEAQQLYPSVLRLFDFGGRIYLTTGHYREAIEMIERGLQASGVRPPSMVAYLAAAHAKLGNVHQATELWHELIARSHANEKGVNVYLVHASLALGEGAAALQWLAKARQTNDVDLIWLAVDPLLRDLPRHSSPNFEAAEKHIEEMLKEQMPDLPYHNRAHVRDVVNMAQHIARLESVTTEDQKIIGMAALLHDMGFIYGSKDHEARGVEIAKEILPRFGFDAGQIGVIANMILATKLPQSPQTQLEKILCDADLDYLGRDDFYEISSNLFKEMQSAGVVENEREWNLVQRTFLQGHRYHTEFGKENREPQKQIRLKEIAERLGKK
jgi:TolB-like protein/predicted metal-dependent HD superfamily phosphohydrolase/Tfp pilus assembly protein PilF